MMNTTTEVASFADTLYALADGTSLSVIQVRADATGGYFESSTDDKGRDWTVPEGHKIDS